MNPLAPDPGWNPLRPDVLPDGSPDPNATAGWTQLYQDWQQRGANMPPMGDWLRGAAQEYANALLMGSTAPEFRAARPTVRPLLAAEREQFGNPATVHDAKYLLPDGKPLGWGDQDHEYIANELGYGMKDEGISRMQQDTGAIRLNIAADLFDGSGDVSIPFRPTPQQMRQLGLYLGSRGRPTGVVYKDDFRQIRDAGELARWMNQVDRRGSP
jgi:hypothetical protein